MKDGLRIEIDFHVKANRKLTMNQVVAFLEKKMRENPDREYYQSGTLYAIVSKPRRAEA